MRHVVRIDTFACAFRRHLGITSQFEESTGVSTGVCIGYSKPNLQHLETRRDHLAKLQLSLLHYIVALSIFFYLTGKKLCWLSQFARRRLFHVFAFPGKTVDNYKVFSSVII